MESQQKNITDRIEKYMGCNPSMALPILDLFIKNKFTKLIMQLEEGVVAQNWASVADIAHDLKGCIAVIIEQKIWDLAHFIEEEAQSPKVDTLKLQKLVGQLREVKFSIPLPA